MSNSDAAVEQNAVCKHCGGNVVINVTFYVAPGACLHLECDRCGRSTNLEPEGLFDEVPAATQDRRYTCDNCDGELDWHMASCPHCGHVPEDRRDGGQA